MNLSKKITLALSALGIAVGALSAQTTIVWDGSSNTVLENPNDGTAQNSNISITPTNVFSTTGGYQSPASTAGVYDGSGGTSPGNADFYASLFLNGATLTSFNLFDGNAGDLLARIQVSNTGAFNGVSSIVAFDFDDTLVSASVSGFGSFGAAVGSYRYVAQLSDDSWIATDTVFTATNTGITASLEDWVSFTPHNAAAVAIGGTATGGNLIDFSGVQHVGYYQAFDTTGGGGIYATGFSATAVPEPSAFTLLAGALALGFSMTRRRK